MGLLSLILILLTCFSGYAAELAGVITDYSTGKPVPGAMVQCEELVIAAIADEDGFYVLGSIHPGRWIIVADAEGYKPLTFAIDIPADLPMVTRDIELKPARTGEGTAEFMETEPRYLLDEIVITTTRASSEHPVTFSNLTHRQVQERNHGQDLPLLFTEMPNVHAYSDGGNGIGYSYLWMRGFNQGRVAVQLNGVPLNDAESHEVFWVDLPDFAKDLQDVQVQRGVGSSLYGAAALGGSINLVTRTPGEFDRPLLRAEGTYGTWNTRRASVLFQSGRIENRYGVTGRLTRMETDGYRYGSWAELWSYYLAAARFTDRHTTRLNFYGGQERVHLSYYGVTEEYLSGEVTGNKENDRRYNPLTNPDEIDNFFQPHYELIDEWLLSDDLRFDNTFYVYSGDGYYDQWKPGKKLKEYFRHQNQHSMQVSDPDTYPSWYYRDDDEDGVPDPDTLNNGSIVYTLERADIFRRRNVSEVDGGWIPRLNLDHRYGQSIFGGEIRLHHGHHEGFVKWANPMPSTASVNSKYYDYRVIKQSLSGYVHNLFDVTARLRAMVDLQVQSHYYELAEDYIYNVEYEKTFSSFNPRFGLNYVLIEPDSKRGVPGGAIYTNVSWAQREPGFRNLYDPQEYDLTPAGSPQRFAHGSSGGEYIGPGLEPEKLINAEIGTHWQWLNTRLGVNYYYMTLRDEIVAENGQLDESGVPLSANADETLHQGVEFVASYTPLTDLEISGNLSVTDHHFVKYSEVDWVLWEEVSRDGNRLANDPDILGNLRVQYEWRGLTGAVSLRYVGKQYTDNSENEDTAIDPYSLVNLDLGYRLTGLPGGVRALELRLRVDNLLDTEYEAFGYGTEYFVGAPRAIYTTMAVEL